MWSGDAGDREPSLQDQGLDALDFSGFQAEIEDFEIGPHVAGIAGASQGHHVDLKGKPEDDLADRPAVMLGDPGQLGTVQYLAVGGEERKALVDQPVGGAELPDAAIPTLGGVAAVLDEARWDACLPAEELKLVEGDVADAQQASPAALLDGL